MDLATPALPFDALNPPRPPRPGAANTPEAIKKVARDFEAAFLSSMLQPIFSQLSTEAPFGGGQGEAAFRSFMVDAIAKKTVSAGGIGLADQLQRQLLMNQGLAPVPASTETA